MSGPSVLQSPQTGDCPGLFSDLLRTSRGESEYLPDALLLGAGASRPASPLPGWGVEFFQFVLNTLHQLFVGGLAEDAVELIAVVAHHADVLGHYIIDQPLPSDLVELVGHRKGFILGGVENPGVNLGKVAVDTLLVKEEL